MEDSPLSGRTVTAFPNQDTTLFSAPLTQGILDTARCVILLLDGCGNILYFNPFMERLCGDTLADAKGENWFERFLPGEDRARIKNLFERSLRGIRTHGNINPIVGKDGSRHYLEWYDTRLDNERGELLALLSIGHDITEHLATERDLQRQREKTRLLVDRRTRELEHWQRHLSRQLQHQQELTAELEAQDESFRALAYVSPVGIFRADPRGAAIYVNRRWSKIAGIDDHQTLGDGWQTVVHPHDRLRVKREWEAFVQHPTEWHAEFRLQRPDGEVRWVECKAVPERNQAGEVRGYAGTVSDITERRRSEQALEESERLFRCFFQQGNIGLAIIAPDGHWMQINQTFRRMLGYDEQELMAGTWETLTHPDDMAYDIAQFERLLHGKIDRYEQDKRFVRKDGDVIHTHLTLAGHKASTGKVEFVILSAQDISEQVRMQAKLQRLALRDPLTGVYNRLELIRRLREEISRARRYRRQVSAFLLDVDHFKRINDRHGHRAGDAALRLLVQGLEEESRRSDYIARFGGEEFVVILPETAPGKALELAQRLRGRVQHSPLELPDGQILHLTVSIGVAAFPDHADDWEELIEAADLAMYQAKQRGRNRVEMTETTAGRRTD
jgi:diguanylate cyclase (GGDEF)-like protein/PAS domain S-box-containing protein